MIPKQQVISINNILEITKENINGGTLTLRNSKKVIFLIIIVLFLVSCTPSFKTVGKYYQYDTGEKLPDLWIELQSKNQWLDDDGMTGRYAINDDQITLFFDFFGEEVVAYEGTISKGVITFTIDGEEVVYAQDGAVSIRLIEGSITFFPDDFTLNQSTFQYEVPIDQTSISLIDRFVSSKGTKVVISSSPSLNDQIIGNLSLTHAENRFYLLVVDEIYSTIVKQYQILIIRPLQSIIYLYSSGSSSTSQVLHVEYGGNLKGLENTLTPPEGYEFSHWIIKNNEEQVVSNTQTLDNYIPVNGHSLYAQFKPKAYQFKLIHPSGEINKTQTYGDNFKWPTLDAQEHYLFDGWSYQDHRVTNKLGDSTGYWSFSDDDEIIIEAIWKGKDYRITFEYENNVYPSRIDYSHLVEYNTFTTITVTSPTHYDFVGWFDTDGKLVSENEVYTFQVKSNTTLIPRFTPKIYTITLIPGEGAEVLSTEPITFSIDQPEYIFLPHATKPNYDFIGWYYDEYFQSPFINSSYTNLQSMNLYAKFLPTSYPIQYIDAYQNHPENPKTYTIESSLLLFSPSREGYEFLGWFQDQSLTIPFGNKGPGGSISVYAKWRVLSYSITYHLNNGTNHEENIQNTTIETVFNLLSPTKTGYEFLGWYDNSELNGNSVTQIKNISNDYHLYASWKAIKTNVTFITNPDGIAARFFFRVNGGSPFIESREYLDGEEIIMPTPPKRDGKIFIGWTESNSCSTLYLVNQNQSISGDRYLTACYIDIPSQTEIIELNQPFLYGNQDKYLFYATSSMKLKLSFQNYPFSSTSHLRITVQHSIGKLETQVNGNQMEINVTTPGYVYIRATMFNPITNITAPVSDLNMTLTQREPLVYNTAKNVVYTATYDAHFSIHPFAYKRFYQILGWFSEPNGQGTQYLNSFGQTLNPWNQTDDMILYAAYAPIAHTIQYNLPESAINHEDNPSSFEEGKPFSLLPASMEHYNFVGWQTNSGILVSTVDELFGNSTIKPIFAPIKYNITYHLDDVLNDNQTEFTIEDRFVLNHPKKNGYQFSGWYFDELFELPFDGIFDGEIDSSISLYGKWNIANNLIAYDLQGGLLEEPYPTQFTMFDTFDLPIPSRIGYNFIGWTYLGEEMDSVELHTTEDLYLEAQWEAIESSIIYHLFDGTNHLENPNTILYSETEITLEPASKEGYTFMGWYLDEDFQTKVISLHSIINDVNLYALYEANHYRITYHTNGGNILDDQEYHIGDEIIKTTPEKEGCSFAGWYLNPTLTVKNEYVSMPSQDLNLYAKWIPYSISIIYDSSIRKINILEPFDASSFQSTAVDSDGSIIPILVSVIGVFEGGQTVSVELKATGKYQMSNSVILDNILLYGSPNGSYNENIKQISFMQTNPIEYLEVQFTDSFNHPIDISHYEIYQGTMEAGNYVQWIIYAVDSMGIQGEIITDPIAIYGTPSIDASDAHVPSDKVLSLEDFALVAKDSFGQDLAVTMEEITHQVSFYHENRLLYVMTASHNGYLEYPREPIILDYDFVGWIDQSGNRFDLATQIQEDMSLYALLVPRNTYTHLIHYYFRTDVSANLNETIEFTYSSQYSAKYQFKVDNYYFHISIIILDDDGNTVPYETDEQMTILWVNLEKHKIYRIFITTTGYKSSSLLYKSISLGLASTDEITPAPYPIKTYRLMTSDALNHTNEIVRDVYLYDDIQLDFSGQLGYTEGEFITKESLGVRAFDSFGYEIDDVKLTYIEGLQIEGEILIYEIEAIDRAGQIIVQQLEIKILGNPTLSFTSPTYIRQDQLITPKLFSTQAFDSFGDPITVDISLKTGYEKLGSKSVVYVITATDSAGQVISAETSLIKVYSKEDIVISYLSDPNIQSVFLEGKGFEFEAEASSSFMENITNIYYETVDGSPLEINKLLDVYLVFEDIAGNIVKSDIITGVIFYDTLIVYHYSTSDDVLGYSHINQGDRIYQFFIAPAPSPYRHGGWFTKPNGEGKKIENGSLVQSSESTIHLYVNYVIYYEVIAQVQTYTVTFNFNDGITPNTSCVVDDQNALVFPDLPRRKNHFFLGWFTQPIGGELLNPNNSITKNMTLYAQWSSTTQNVLNINEYFNPYPYYQTHSLSLSVPYSGEYILKYTGSVKITHSTPNSSPITYFESTPSMNRDYQVVYLNAGSIYTVILKTGNDGEYYQNTGTIRVTPLLPPISAPRSLLTSGTIYNGENILSDFDLVVSQYDFYYAPTKDASKKILVNDVFDINRIDYVYSEELRRFIFYAFSKS